MWAKLHFCYYIFKIALVSEYNKTIKRQKSIAISHLIYIGATE
jgi:hypothetical protein